MNELSRLQLFSAIAFLLCGLAVHHSVKGIGSDYTVSVDEEKWRIACSALFAPLFMEFVLDEVTWLIYPSLRSHTKEDPANHWFIIVSLVPSTHFSLMLLGGNVSMVAREIMLSFGHVLLVFSILRKLETFSIGIIERAVTLTLFALYSFSEFCLRFGVHDKLDSLHQNCIFLSLVIKVLVILIMLSSTHVVQKMLMPKRDGTNLFTDQCYIRFILMTALITFLVWDTVNSLYMIAYPFDKTCQITQRIASHLTCVLIAAILPGRITRRGLAAVEESNIVLKEMACKKTFVRYISHEVRSPLSTTCLGLDCLLQLVQSSQPLDRAELLELVTDCKTTCTVAISTLSDLLLYDKIENNMLQLEKAEVDCMQFIEHCVRPMEKQMKFAGLEWHLHVDERVSECSLSADSMKMEQVLRNFITNAIKFTPAGGSISLHASIYSPASPPASMHFPGETSQRTSSLGSPSAAGGLSAERSSLASSSGDLRFRCEITDTGVGISQENQAKLFGQYVQFEANKLQHGGGSGLGLWLSKAIIEAHGGIVGVRSKGIGFGSTFFFDIPVHRHASTRSLSPLRVGLNIDGVFSVEGFRCNASMEAPTSSISLERADSTEPALSSRVHYPTVGRSCSVFREDLSASVESILPFASSADQMTHAPRRDEDEEQVDFHRSECFESVQHGKERPCYERESCLVDHLGSSSSASAETWVERGAQNELHPDALETQRDTNHGSSAMVAGRDEGSSGARACSVRSGELLGKMMNYVPSLQNSTDDMLGDAECRSVRLRSQATLGKSSVSRLPSLLLITSSTNSTPAPSLTYPPSLSVPSSPHSHVHHPPPPPPTASASESVAPSVLPGAKPATFGSSSMPPVLNLDGATVWMGSSGSKFSPRALTFHVLIADDAALTRKIVERMIVMASSRWTARGSTILYSTPEDSLTLAGSGNGDKKLDACGTNQRDDNCVRSCSAHAVLPEATPFTCLEGLRDDARTENPWPTFSSVPCTQNGCVDHRSKNTAPIEEEISMANPHQAAPVHINSMLPMLSVDAIEEEEEDVEENEKEEREGERGGVGLTPLPSASCPPFSPVAPSCPLRSSSSPSSPLPRSGEDHVMVKIEHAANGELALDMVIGSMQPHCVPIDVVLIDYFMPVMDGPTTISLMRAHGFLGVIVAVTASTSQDDQRRLMDAGATAVMSKPFNIQSFQEILAKHRCTLHT